MTPMKCQRASDGNDASLPGMSEDVPWTWLLLSCQLSHAAHLNLWINARVVARPRNIGPSVCLRMGDSHRDSDTTVAFARSISYGHAH